MALVTVGHLAAEVRGSVGSVTVKGVRGARSAQSRSRGRANPTNVSLGRFGLFGEVSARWGLLSRLDRLAWDGAAGGVGRGQALFMRVVYRRFSADGVWQLTPPSASICGALLTLSLAASVAGPEFLITWTSTVVDPPQSLMLEFAAFPSAAAATPGRGWLGPGYLGSAVSGSVDLGPFLVDVWNQFQVGRSVGVRCGVFDSGSGNVSGRLVARAIVQPAELLRAAVVRSPGRFVRWPW